MSNDSISFTKALLFFLINFSYCSLAASTSQQSLSSSSYSVSTKSESSKSDSSSSTSVGSLDEFIEKKNKANSSDPHSQLIVVFPENIGFERDGERAYKADGLKFPYEIKCKSSDYRTIHGCLKIRFFDPSARVYFDGGDAEEKLDMFNNGNLNASINFASLYLPWRFGRSGYFDVWSWGPAVGIGVSAPAQSSDDESKKSSGAPVVLASVGFQVEYALNNSGASFGFELGRGFGFSTDESLKDSNDQATYVGLKINIPTSSHVK